MIDVSLDLRQALRGLRRGRTLTLATVLILALGIGSAAAMYAVVEQVLLRPLPVRDQGRLIVAWGAFQSSSLGHVPLSYPNLNAIRQRSRVFQQVAGLDYNGSWGVVGRTGVEAAPLRLGVVVGDFFATLGMQPELGRMLNIEDDRVGAAPVAVISRGLWLRRFGGDSAILGKALPIWTKVYTIVGIVPGDFELPASRSLGHGGRDSSGTGDSGGLWIFRYRRTAPSRIYRCGCQTGARSTAAGDQSRCMECR